MAEKILGVQDIRGNLHLQLQGRQNIGVAGDREHTQAFGLKAAARLDRQVRRCRDRCRLGHAVGQGPPGTVLVLLQTIPRHVAYAEALHQA
jgi:hypothetical protein